MPVVSSIIGAVFLGESITVKKLLGILTVLAGAAVILINQKKRQNG